MLSYKDKAYCSSKYHKLECDRKATAEDLRKANAMGLPIAYMALCGNTVTIKTGGKQAHEVLIEAMEAAKNV